MKDADLADQSRRANLRLGGCPAILGGRGLSARILLDEVDPTYEPLGAKNKLVFAPGLLVGHMLSSCDRISIGAKSSLTRGLRHSSVSAAKIWR